MNVTCTAEHLRNAVTTAERFTGKNITVPIISHILITAKERKIIITATNLEVGIEFSIPGKIEKSGSVTVPARQFSQILQTFSQDENINLDVSDRITTITTARSKTTIIGLDPSDFPTLPIIKKDHSFSISSESIIQSLERVILAAGITDLKPELAGVLLKVDPKNVTTTATDSFRLAEATMGGVAGITDVIECIIPSRTIQELLRIVSPEGEIEVKIGEHQIVFSWESVRILSRLIDGSYPPYKNLLPKTFESTIVAGRSELLKKINLASVFSSRLNDVTLHYSPTELEVSTQNSETGAATSSLEVKGRGNSGSVVFNYRYLVDGLNAAGGEEVVINLNGVSGPALIQNPGETTFLYLLMPIRSV